MNNNCRFGFLTVVFVAALTMSTFIALADESADKTKPVSEAEKFFNAMSPEQRSDPVVLDDFIRRFPNSDQAQIALLFRYILLENKPTIEGYNDFIAKYPKKLQAQVAIQNLFELYRHQDRVAGYFDFIKRYPDSPQATVAMMRIQELMFEYFCMLDEEEEYDAFISAFPDAPQVNAVLKKAYDKALEKENEKLKKFQNSDPKPTREDWMDYVSENIANWEYRVNTFIQRNPDPDAPANNDAQIELYRIKRMADVFLSATIKDSSKEIRVYARYDHSGRISHKLENLQIAQRLIKIQKTPETNHK